MHVLLILLIDSSSECRYLLEEMYMAQKKATVIHEDNQPCIAIVDDAAKAFGGMSKHRDMRVKKVKEMQQDEIVQVSYCITAKMLADMFTKNVNFYIFSRLAAFITGRCTRTEVALISWQ